MAKETISGYAGLDKKLKMLGDQKTVIKISKAAVNKSLTPVVKAARQNVPKGTKAHKTYKGRLVSPGFASRNIGKNVKLIGDRISGLVGVKGEAFYAIFFENGTANMERRPWLRKSFDMENSTKVFSRTVEEWIVKEARKK